MADSRERNSQPGSGRASWKVWRVRVLFSEKYRSLLSRNYQDNRPVRFYGRVVPITLFDG